MNWIGYSREGFSRHYTSVDSERLEHLRWMKHSRSCAIVHACWSNYVESAALRADGDNNKKSEKSAKHKPERNGKKSSQN